MVSTPNLDQTISLLLVAPVGKQPPIICFLTGSSGCGKTFLAESIAVKLKGLKAEIIHFDRVGVPTVEKMISECGSVDKWQEKTTREWVNRIAAIRDKAVVFFEGQYNPKFALDAAMAKGLKDYKLAVVTADQTIWQARLSGSRGQPALVNDDMRNWAKYLKDETVKLGGAVIDTSKSNVDKNIEEVMTLVNPLLARRC